MSEIQPFTFPTTGQPVRTVTINASARARFAEKFDRSGDCWTWSEKINKEGYGLFSLGHEWVRAHRVAYVLAGGVLETGLELDHVCHNRDLGCPGGYACLHRRCVNPAHLEQVTHKINTLRGRTIPTEHAAKTHCPQGHLYDAANTYCRPGRHERQCRACRSETMRSLRKRIADRRAEVEASLIGASR